MGDLKDVAEKLESNAATLTKLFEESDKLMKQEIDFARRNYGADPEKDGKANKDLNGDGKTDDKDNAVLAGFEAERKGLDRIAGIIDDGRASLRPQQQVAANGGSVAGPEVMAAMNMMGAPAQGSPTPGQAMPGMDPNVSYNNSAADQITQSRTALETNRVAIAVRYDQIEKILKAAEKNKNGVPTPAQLQEINQIQKELKVYTESREELQRNIKQAAGDERGLEKREFQSNLKREEQYQKYLLDNFKDIREDEQKSAADWRKHFIKQRELDAKFDRDSAMMLQKAQIEMGKLYDKKVTIPAAEQEVVGNAQRGRRGEDLKQAAVAGVLGYFLGGNRLEVGLGAFMSQLDPKSSGQFRNGISLATGILNSQSRRERRNSTNTTPAVYAPAAVLAGKK